MVPWCLILFSIVCCCPSFSGEAFSIERRRFPGVWKLKSDSLPHEQDIRSKLKGVLQDGYPEEVLIKLNPDGSFKQCNEGYSEGRWLAGCWEVKDEEQLVLALRRQYYGPQFDVILEGRVEGTSTLKVEGEVQKGKFMYPLDHPEFFESPLVNQEALGNFTLEQSIATSSVTPAPVQDRDKENRFERSDFYDRDFILTVEPIEGKKSSDVSIPDLPVDIRAMPVRFFGNNTFRALGTNKILRGRFDITDNDELAFGISLFGIGRSVSGSVYSEGLGLTHEDERNYIGSIDETDGKFRVEGTVTVGDDMGSDAPPEPVGTFILIEMPLVGENAYYDLGDDEFGVFE